MKTTPLLFPLPLTSAAQAVPCCPPPLKLKAFLNVSKAGQ
jgi:hypothetical protein